MPLQPQERDVLRRSISGIPKDELVDFCEGELGAPADNGKAWADRSKKDLVEALLDGLPESRARGLAADGESRVRSPGFHGFIWHLRDYVGDKASAIESLRGLAEQAGFKL